MRTLKFPALGLRLAALMVFALTFRAETFAAATNHCLWKLQGKRNTVHLLGSVHFLKESHYPLAAPIESAFSNAAVVAFETDLGEMELPKTQVKLVSAGKLPPSQTLQQQLTQATYNKLRARLQESAVPVNVLDPFKPWFASVTLVAVELQRLGFDPKNGVDRHFYDKAQKDNKPIIGLETVESQINMLADLSKENGDAFVNETLRQLGTVKNMLDDLVRAWSTGDTKRLDELLNEAFKDFPNLHKLLLLDRNRIWLPKIEELAQGEKNAIVIVGAAHLVGKESVVDLLRKKGYQVAQE